MNNFINVRIQATNNDKTKSDVKHNLRLIKSRNNENSNQNINMDSNGNILNNQDMKNILLDYKEDRILHNELFKENNNNRNLRNRNSTWMNGIFSFSEKIHIDLGNKYSQKEFIKIGLEAGNDLAKHLGTDLKYITLHLDEKTPHFQFHLGNFDSQGKSIFHKFNKTEEFIQLQDLGYKHFKSLGMDRGISKDKTGVNCSSRFIRTPSRKSFGQA